MFENLAAIRQLLPGRTWEVRWDTGHLYAVYDMTSTTNSHFSGEYEVTFHGGIRIFDIIGGRNHWGYWNVTLSPDGINPRLVTYRRGRHWTHNVPLATEPWAVIGKVDSMSLEKYDFTEINGHQLACIYSQHFNEAHRMIWTPR